MPPVQERSLLFIPLYDASDVNLKPSTETLLTQACSIRILQQSMEIPLLLLCTLF